MLHNGSRLEIEEEEAGISFQIIWLFYGYRIINVDLSKPGSISSSEYYSGAWLGQFVCGLFTNGDLWCIGHPDEAGGRGTDP